MKIVEDYSTIDFGVKAFRDIDRITQNNLALSPLNDKEKSELLRFIDKREKNCFKPIHYATELKKSKITKL